MKKYFIYWILFALLCSCSDSEKKESSSSDSNEPLFVVNVSDTSYENCIQDITNKYIYIQRGYDILDSLIDLKYDTNDLEDRITYILYCSELMHRAQTELFVYQFKLRNLYCDKIRETFDEYDIKQKYPDYYNFFANNINDLTSRESLAYDGLIIYSLLY